MKVPSWIEPAIWSLVIGAIGTWVTLSFGFGWMSAGAAAKMAVKKSQEAVVAYATPVCVARFKRLPNAVSDWATLKKTEEWDRGGILEKDGLVSGPNQKLDPDTADAVANNCASKIIALKTLGGAQLSMK